MVVISTRGVNTMYEECVCEIFFQIKIFFISKTFFEFAGTSQKWVKNRLPRSRKKSKIIDFAVGIFYGRNFFWSKKCSVEKSKIFDPKKSIGFLKEI